MAWYRTARLFRLVATSGWSRPSCFSRTSRLRRSSGSASAYRPMAPVQGRQVVHHCRGGYILGAEVLPGQVQGLLIFVRRLGQLDLLLEGFGPLDSGLDLLPGRNRLGGRLRDHQRCHRQRRHDPTSDYPEHGVPPSRRVRMLAFRSISSGPLCGPITRADRVPVRGADPTGHGTSRTIVGLGIANGQKPTVGGDHRARRHLSAPGRHCGPLDRSTPCGALAPCGSCSAPSRR